MKSGNAANVPRSDSKKFKNTDKTSLGEFLSDAEVPALPAGKSPVAPPTSQRDAAAASAPGAPSTPSSTAKLRIGVEHLGAPQEITDHHSSISGGSGVIVTDPSYGFPSSGTSATFEVSGSSASSKMDERSADGKQQQGGNGLQSRPTGVNGSVGSSVVKKGLGKIAPEPTVVVANSAPVGTATPAGLGKKAPVVENKDSRAKESDLRPKAEKKEPSERTPEHPIQQ